MKNTQFIPTSKKEMISRGWSELDFLIISGDAYVDHPSFGIAIITRVLESKGYKVGIIDQPDWKGKKDFLRLGIPKLAILLSSGNLDSMVNHYTANRKKRNEDSYSPGGKIGKRPDRALIVYANRIKEIFHDIPLIIGGVEASLRRFSHYDYWSDKIRRSIIFDTRADLLVYGMGENTILEIAEILKKKKSMDEMQKIRGIVYISKDITHLSSEDYIKIPSHEEVIKSKIKFAEAFKLLSGEQDYISGKIVVQPHNDRYLIQNKSAIPLSTKMMDKIYELPYTREYHPKYEKMGGIPALKEIKFSITLVRGCFGSCNFCSITFHQGKHISRRSHNSIIKEAKQLINMSDFKGYIHDVGGPTANFLEPACPKQEKFGNCKNKDCTAPVMCKNLKVDHSYLLNLLRKLRKLPGIKKIFIRSGIRFDYLIADKNEEFFEELLKYHVSGQLKVAPEHISDRVLKIMGKPKGEIFKLFTKRYKEICKKYGLKQYIVPYFIASHPGATLNDAVKLAKFINELGFMPEQVQDFYPTPGTASTCIYYSELNPYNGKKVYVAKKGRERKMQRALIQYKKRENYRYVKEALLETGNVELIGNGKNCLIGRYNKNR